MNYAHNKHPALPTDNVTYLPGKRMPVAARAPNARSKRAAELRKLQAVLTPLLGCGIPVLVMALSNLIGKLLVAGATQYLVYGAGFVLAAVLLVSMSHVADGLREITKVPRLHAWCMAIALDASLVVCEATNVTEGLAPKLCWSIIGGVALVSAALNVFAFKRAQQSRRRKAR